MGSHDLLFTLCEAAQVLFMKSPVIEPLPTTIADLFNGLATLVDYSILLAETKTQMLTNFETCIKLAHEALSSPYVNLLVAQAIYAGINTVGVSTLNLEEKIGRREKEYLHESQGRAAYSLPACKNRVSRSATLERR